MKKENHVLDFLLVLAFYVLLIFLKVWIVEDLIKWYKIPIKLNETQLFGIIIILGVVFTKSHDFTKEKESEKVDTTTKTVTNGIMNCLMLLMVWLIFYIIYAVLFK